MAFINWIHASTAHVEKGQLRVMLNNMPLSANVMPLTQPRVHHLESAESSVTRTLPHKENAAPWYDTVGLGGGGAGGLDLEAMSNPPKKWTKLAIL